MKSIKVCFLLALLSSSSMCLYAKGQVVEEPLMVCLPSLDASLTVKQKETLARRLGYSPSADACSKRSFNDPDLDFVAQGFLKPGETDLNAGEVHLKKDGISELGKGIVLKQPNRMLTAQSATILRREDKVSEIKLIGQVKLFEPGTRLLSDQASFNYQTGAGTLTPLLYRMSFKGDSVEFNDPKAELALIAWGWASKVNRNDKEVYYFDNATLSVCPPKELTWQIKARKLEIDKKTGQGEVHKAWLEFEQVPLFYLPYWSFSLDNQRKSGFLTPRVSYRSINGVDVLVPYYLNLAPNYDLTLLPHYFENRGLMAGGEFRYLFPWGEGTIDGTFLKDDNLYRSFLSDNNLLEGNTDLNRSEFNWRHHLKVQDWTLDIDYGELSDDYYPTDFATRLNFTQNNQVKREAKLSLDKENVYFSIRMLRFQTLHPIVQSTTADIYRLYPQVDFAFWHPLSDNIHFELQSQLSEFDWGRGTLSPPTGSRLYLSPRVSGIFYLADFEVEPSVILDTRHYQLDNYAGGKQDFSNVIPRLSLDVSREYSKNWPYSKGVVKQILTPRLNYLYVPYKDQTTIPLFDTSETIFTYGQLFDSNRFSGIDRIGDSNRLSIGLESDFLQEESGRRFMSLSLGQGYYFASRQVIDCFSTTGSCSVPSDTPGSLSSSSHWTPFTLEGDLKLSNAWSVFLNNAYEVDDGRMNNSVVDLHYAGEAGSQADLAYAFLKYGDNINLSTGYQNSANLSQIRLSYAWPLSPRLKAIAGYSYNFGFGHEMGYFGALQYESCCVASRFLAGRLFNSLGTQGSPEYNNVVYWQILLKGLGGLTNGSFSGLMNQFARYNDLG